MLRTTLPILFAVAALALSSCQMQEAGATPPQGGPRPPMAEGKMCGGIAGFQCKPDLTCDMASGQCRTADAAGTCRRIPQICTMEYRPVCGCDGKTYGNACNARAAGASVDHDGACSP